MGAGRLRAKVEPALTLIELTGYGQPEDRARALREGFDAHLVKPINPEELRRVLATPSA